jgi:acyl carrier protein
MNIKERIYKNLEENGIGVNDDGSLINVDSMNFISSIVCIEQEFEIEFPEEYLLIESLSNIENITYIVNHIINNNQYCD